MFRKLTAEFIGTFWLVFGGVGSAVYAAAFPELGIGFLGVALAFGLSVTTMAYSVGHISGSHFNPAVTAGLWAGGRFPIRDVIPYIVSQVLAAIAAAALLYIIATGSPAFDLSATGLGENGYGSKSPGNYGLLSVALIEALLTFFFLIIIMGSTHSKAPVGFAPIAIGLSLTLIHLISIPLSNTSVNPARSTGPALIVGGLAIQQLWLFWIAPVIGGIAGGITYKALSGDVAPDITGQTNQAAGQEAMR